MSLLCSLPTVCTGILLLIINEAAFVNACKTRHQLTFENLRDYIWLTNSPTSFFVNGRIWQSNDAVVLPTEKCKQLQSIITDDKYPATVYSTRSPVGDAHHVFCQIYICTETLSPVHTETTNPTPSPSDTDSPTLYPTYSPSETTNTESPTLYSTYSLSYYPTSSKIHIVESTSPPDTTETTTLTHTTTQITPHTHTGGYTRSDQASSSANNNSTNTTHVIEVITWISFCMVFLYALHGLIYGGRQCIRNRGSETLKPPSVLSVYDSNTPRVVPNCAYETSEYVLSETTDYLTPTPAQERIYDNINMCRNHDDDYVCEDNN